MTEFELSDMWLAAAFSLIGYALLGFALFDFLSRFIPPHFLNAFWEVEMIKSLIDRLPILLLGVGLVLLGEKKPGLRKTFSIVSLILGVLFLLMVPLCINDGWRIYQENTVGINNQITQQLTQLENAKTETSRATTEKEINDVLTKLNLKVNSPEVKTPDDLKSKLLARISQVEREVRLGGQEKMNRLSFLMMKTFSNLLLQTGIAGVVFLLLGRKSLVMLARLWE